MDQDNNTKESSCDLYKWKQSFYKAYKKKDFVTAEKIYLTREQFNRGVPDVHTAYKLLRKLDYAQAVVVLATMAFVLTCLFGLTECVA